MIRINIPQPYSCKDCKFKYSVQSNTVIGATNYSSNIMAGYDYICCCINQIVTNNVYYGTFHQQCPIDRYDLNTIVNTTNMI